MIISPKVNIIQTTKKMNLSIVNVITINKDRIMVEKNIRVRDIRVDVPEGQSGDWRIERFTVDDAGASMHNLRDSIHGGGRGIVAGKYTKLMRGNTIVMSDTPAEIADHSYFVRSRAKGNVLINGLGLGWAVEALLQSEKVKTITVVEKSKDVINLVKQHYYDKCPKDKYLIIVHADALDYKPKRGQRFDAVWHDIWDYICGDNLEDMKTLHRKYGRRCDWQGSWCRYQCEVANRRY